jgi:hypothetical protein
VPAAATAGASDESAAHRIVGPSISAAVGFFLRCFFSAPPAHTRGRPPRHALHPGSVALRHRPCPLLRCCRPPRARRPVGQVRRGSGPLLPCEHVETVWGGAVVKMLILPTCSGVICVLANVGASLAAAFHAAVLCHAERASAGHAWMLTAPASICVRRSTPRVSIS